MAPDTTNMYLFTMHATPATTAEEWRRCCDDLRNIIRANVTDEDWPDVFSYGPTPDTFDWPAIAIEAPLTFVQILTITAALRLTFVAPLLPVQIRQLNLIYEL